MLRHSFQLVFRTISRNKIFSLLNIGGLAIGIACAAFIFLWVENERTYNQDFSKRNNLFAVMEKQETDGQMTTQRGGPVPLAQGIKNKITGIKNTARMSWPLDQVFIVGNKIFSESGQYADSSILSLLNCHFVHGTNPSLVPPESIVISESMSKAIFGNADPVGKTLRSKQASKWIKPGLYTITGVFQDFPANSSYHFNWLSPYKLMEDMMHPEWNKWDMPVETLVELEPTADVAKINRQLSQFMKEKLAGTKIGLFLFSMNDWNLYSHFSNDKPDGGKIQYVNMFSLIAVIILLIACINFMNLSTARSEKRAKEVGIRKVSGAHRYQLVFQFIRESATMALLAVLLAMVLITLWMPMFNRLLGANLEARIFSPNHLLFLLGTGVVCGLVSGLYPAFYLSAFQPITVLKGLKLQRKIGAIFIRKGLVTIQFTVSIILIIGTAIVYQQIQYAKTRDLGYKTQRMIEMGIPERFPAHFETVKQQLVESGAIDNAAMAYNPMLQISSYSNDYTWAGKSPRNVITVYDLGVSTGYLATMHMKLKAGRNFNPGETIDSNHTLIINETLAKLMGAEGKPGGTISRKGFPDFHVVGIMQDFIFNDMYGSGAPIMIGCDPLACDHLFLSLSPQMETRKALDKISAVLKATEPEFPFVYRFVDEELNELFATENMISRLTTIFAVLAILISCLGLFGLAAYTAEKRTKEIGIRKVLGAGIGSLAALLSKEFLQLVCLSCLIAFPLAWRAGSAWLRDYQYRISISWIPFISAGLGALCIALLTVSFQAVKTAMANPVKSLRTE